MNEQALNISTGRKYWIDVLRALGIILVVLGHVSKEPNTVIFIYAFHMPLFFLLSGFLFNRHRYDLHHSPVSKIAATLCILLSVDAAMVVAGRVQFPPPLSALGSLGGNV